MSERFVAARVGACHSGRFTAHTFAVDLPVVDNGVVTTFQVWAGNLQGQEFDDDSSYTINPVTGVLTIHWADGRASHYSPGTWQRIEDQSTRTAQDRGVI
ncbi:hypothetical protein ACVBEQ_04800 [Nakamurella sp. GG22]